ncbi:hypothetical protein [Pseudomonas sp. DWP3-1-2]|uniref:hypothetical protein n=1 Tax=Pseudomonas sp. DWP3-1-2 TaxID=2804645 RepID=UPI003CF7663B
MEHELWAREATNLANLRAPCFMGFSAMNKEFLTWVVLASSFSIILNCLVMLYVDHFILPKVEDQLKNCKLVASARAFWGLTGKIGKIQRSAMVYLALTSTLRLSEKGMVDIDEVRRVSRRDRRWICIPMWVFIVSMSSGMIAMTLLRKL